jgi:preprotein translocase subunit SecD
MLSSVVCADYDASDLKKLFTDSSQRAQIDAVRSGKNTGSELQQTTKVSVSGYVTRSDGKSVVWVNDKNTLDSSKVDDVKVQQSTIGNNKKVTITVDGKTARLKPGETWSKETGKIVENH